MNETELKDYIETQGYSHVKVKENAKGFVVHFWDRQTKNRLVIPIPLSEIKLGGKWLTKRFPKVNPEYCSVCGKILSYNQPPYTVNGKPACYECHQSEHAYRIGLSSTPYRKDGLPDLLALTDQSGLDWRLEKSM